MLEEEKQKMEKELSEQYGKPVVCEIKKEGQKDIMECFVEGKSIFKL